MSQLAGQWIGTAYGTNSGNLFMEIEEDRGQLSGTIRLNEPGTGVIVYSFTGEANDTIDLRLVPVKAPDGVELEPGRAIAILQPEGTLTGRWETDLGTAGTFQLHRHRALERSEPLQQGAPAVPEQVFFHTVPIGAVRLYKADLRRFFDAIARDFVQARPVVTYLDHGVQVTKFADAFLRDEPDHPLKSLKVSIQELQPSGLTRLVNVDLFEGAGSQVRTSGSNESWVIGRTQTLQSIIRVHENKLVSWYRTYGLSLNIFIFFLMLVAVPEIPGLPERAAFVGVIYVLLVILAQIYNRLVPNTLVFASDRKPSWWSRVWPTFASWLAALTSSLVAMWVFWFFTKH